MIHNGWYLLHLVFAVVGQNTHLKSDNLQYDMLGYWVVEMNIIWCSINFFLLKTLYFFLCKFVKKNKMKQFLQRIFQENMKKISLGTSDAWSMSHSSHRNSVLYWRLLDFFQLWQCHFYNTLARNNSLCPLNWGAQVSLKIS